jgi:hypothetical protein
VAALTHLSLDVLHRLMRLFMEHRTDVLPVVERGRVVGQIDRLTIVEALSEIKPEGYSLSVKPPESANELLRRLDNGGGQSLPTINSNFEFNALWTRTEILQAEGKIPQVKVWQPPANEDVPRPQEPLAPRATVQLSPSTVPAAETRPQTENETPAESIPRTISIARETRPLASEPAAPRLETRTAAESLHRDIERGRLAINTLAALELPLLACDGNGNEIFHNRALAEIRMRDQINLRSGDLVVRAKDAIAEIALKGDLDINAPIRLKAGPRGYDIFCKGIRDFDKPDARAVGYIFWLQQSSAPPSALYTASEGETNYAGRTLPEILAAEESRAMAWAMREANDNQSDAALLLGIPRQTFNYRYRRLQREAKMLGRKKSIVPTEKTKTPET